MYAIITGQTPICVKYLQQTVRDDAVYTLNDTIFEAFIDDFVAKQPEPSIIPKGKTRIFYVLNN